MSQAARWRRGLFRRETEREKEGAEEEDIIESAGGGALGLLVLGPMGGEGTRGGRWVRGHSAGSSGGDPAAAETGRTRGGANGLLHQMLNNARHSRLTTAALATIQVRRYTNYLIDENLVLAK